MAVPLALHPPQLPLGSWLLPAAGTLRQLGIYQNSGVLVVPAPPPAWHRLTALQELSLCAYDGGDLKLEAGCRLPSRSLTSLWLGTSEDWSACPSLPPAVRGARSLRAWRGACCSRVP